jgi:leucyl aminopeptidase
LILIFKEIKMLKGKWMLFLVFTLCAGQSLAEVKFDFASAPPADAKHMAIFVSDMENLNTTASEIEKRSNGQLSRALAAQKFEAKKDATATLYGIAGIDRLVVLGLDQNQSFDAVALQNLGGKVAKIIGVELNGDTLAIDTSGLTTQQADASAHMALGYQLQNYRFDKYKSKKLNTNGQVVFVSNTYQQAQKTYSNDLKHIAQGVYLTRNLSSEPGKTIYPQSFVDAVKAQFKGVKNVKFDVLTLKDMQQHNMGALIGVGKGSVHEPKLLVIEYRGADKDQQPIALAGKGITFDSGGISLKKNSGMWAMKSDMAGAAAVAGTLYAAAMRGENVNLVGLMAMAENMPAADAIRPGDVLSTMQGTTIEIISTDAEGRLVLADAVYYAQQEYNPKMLVNIATLTGSASRALGDEFAVVITRDWELSQQMMKIGEVSGEHVWPLPLHPNHFKQIKSDIADIKNSGAGNPGASIGAAVIGTFVDENLPWIHLDIASVDWYTEATDTTPKGSSGWGVRFLDQLIRENK